MSFNYDFVAESSIKQEIEACVFGKGVKIRHPETCHVLKFQTGEQVFMVIEAPCRIYVPFTPTGLAFFQLKADSSWYLAFVVNGTPLRKFIASGFLKQYSSIYGVKSSPLFIPEGYPTMIRNIVTSALLLLPSPVRCRIEIDSIFVKYDLLTSGISAWFVRCDVQEFRLNGITMFCLHERMEFIEKLYELIRSGNCVIYCDETKDAFEKDWHEKLYSIYVQLMEDGSWKTDGSNDWIKKRDASFSGPSLEDVDMKRCIASISEMYHNFVDFGECDMVIREMAYAVDT